MKMDGTDSLSGAIVAGRVGGSAIPPALCLARHSGSWVPADLKGDPLQKRENGQTGTTWFLEIGPAATAPWAP